MAAKLPVAALLLLSALFVCVFAQQNEELSLLELTRGFKGTTVKPSSYGGYTVIQSCLELSQIKNCACLGNICPIVENNAGSCIDGPTGGSLSTDFTCCGDKHDYGYGPSTALGDMTISGRAATCSWDFTALKELHEGGKVTANYICVQDDPTKPTCKLGPVNGICHFTDESDKCQGPYYDDMAITIRGHLYLTAAYSKERGNTLSTPGMGDTCWQTAQLFNEISNPSSHRLSAEGVKKTTSATGPAKAAGSFPITQNAPGGPTAEFFRTLIEGAFATTGLQANFDNAMTGYCSAPEGSEHHNDRYYGHDGLNAGWALVVMGETSISSMKSNLKVEETGHVEFTVLFQNKCPHVPYEQQWPHVRGGAMKVWFKQEDDKGHPEHRY